MVWYVSPLQGKNSVQKLFITGTCKYQLLTLLPTEIQGCQLYKSTQIVVFYFWQSKVTLEILVMSSLDKQLESKMFNFG